MTVDHTETTVRPGGYTGRVVIEQTEAYGRIGTFVMAGDDDFAYRAALYVNENGIQYSRSALSAIDGGSFDERQAENIEIRSTSDDFNGIIISGAVKYRISGSRFSFPSHNDGRIGCDFTGYGAVIFVLDGAEVEIEDCEFYTEGVVRPCVYVDSHANVIMRRCKYLVAGGELFSDYQSNAETDKMVAPPWVLGIGGNCRGVNLMGFNSSLTIVDCDCAANGWGVISTDIGTNQKVTVVDSDITVNLTEDGKKDPFLRRYGPGYGSYSTGDYAHCNQYFYGVQFHVGKYATIINQGNAMYASSAGIIKVFSPDEYPEHKLCEIKGKGRKTRIESDGFGFMTHGPGRIELTDGTVVESDSATFLIRSSDVRIRADGQSKLIPADGILIQMMDNDDTLVGVVPSDEPYSCTFNSFYSEPEGWPSENGSITGGAPSDECVKFTAADISLEGNIYNGTGYYGLPASGLKVRLEKGAVLEGDIRETETRHVDENGKQCVRFTSEQYYYIGRVENRPYSNGGNTIDMVLKDDAKWLVTGGSSLSSLLVTDEAVILPKKGGLEMTVDGVETPLEHNRFYKGRIEICIK